jgi:hypothetical protein
LIGDSVAISLSNGLKARVFGKILANESIGILIGPALPRMIRIGEVAGYWESLFNSFVAMEFGTVVESNGEELLFVFLDSLNARVGDFKGGSSLDLFDDYKAGFSFNESHNTMMTVLADYRIAFPMANNVA